MVACSSTNQAYTVLLDANVKNIKGKKQFPDSQGYKANAVS